jgi:ABC-type antimicrobial peptide transport system permease subunit
MNIRTLTPDIYQHFEAFRNDLIKTGAIAEVAESSTLVTESNNSQSNFDWEGKSTSGNTQTFATVGISKEYGKTVGWQFIDGRDYRTGSGGADALAFILNESAAKLMGFKETVGSTVRWMGYNFHVIGVVKDMVMESPFESVEPTIFYMSPWKISFLNVRLKPGVRLSGALKTIEDVYKQYNPGQPFEYKFADLEYTRKFDIENRVKKLATFFAILAIFISCLGIFGMASFMAEQRTKEIGIRKVLGASVFNLWQLSSKEFVIMVLVSLIIATPLAYYFMDNWLQNYQYRIKISWWMFAVAGATAIFITLLTVSYQSLRAAIANPVKSLRAE